MISPVAGGLIRTWTSEGSRLWSVEDPDWLSGVLGRGLVGRTPMPNDRFREAVFLNSDDGTLLVQSRYASGAGRSEVEVEVEVNVVQLGEPTRPEANPWYDMDRFLSAVAVSAADRGEYYVAELGGWDAPTEPYCLFAVMDQGDGPMSLLEAAPAPRGTDFWPEVPHEQPGSTVVAPASDKTLSVAGVFVTAAIHTWGVAPWDIALTFGSLKDLTG
ncbi:hypothetical protein EF834_14055 [Rhodococcus spongiicola]|uniref:Uncharacterized protein n=2 Tax=Rhodococcus spongiicola TaxID=2487352 RepID=A0A3S3B2S4_9NOCA|nr:hypothetical protein EF834_14055 [Rhodococcus spongiicola]